MSGEAFGIPKKRYDAKLAGGWPVDLTHLPEQDREIWEQALMEAAKEGHGPVYYPGSVVRRCPDCYLEIFVGPRTQVMMKEDPEVVVKCFVCVVKTMAEAYKSDPEHFGVDQFDLGNRYGIPRSY